MLAATIFPLRALYLISKTPLSCCCLPKCEPKASYQSAVCRGDFVSVAIVLSRFSSIASSLPPIYFPVGADRLTDSRTAGVLASVSWRQWQWMQVITMPSQGLLLCLPSLCGWFQGMFTPLTVSALLGSLNKRNTFCNLPLRCSNSFVKG